MSAKGATWPDPAAGGWPHDAPWQAASHAPDAPFGSKEPARAPSSGFTRGIRLTDAVLLDMNGGDSPLLTGVDLVVDAAGIGVALSQAEIPRVLPWTSISTIEASEVAPSLAADRPSLMVRVITATSAYRFLIRGADPSQISSTLDRLATGYTGRRLVRVEGGAPVVHSGPPSTFERLRPFLVGLTVAMVAAIVAIILAQSAGAIHISFLGGP